MRTTTAVPSSTPNDLPIMVSYLEDTAYPPNEVASTPRMTPNTLGRDSPVVGREDTDTVIDLGNTSEFNMARLS